MASPRPTTDMIVNISLGSTVHRARPKNVLSRRLCHLPDFHISIVHTISDAGVHHMIAPNVSVVLLI